MERKELGEMEVNLAELEGLTGFVVIVVALWGAAILVLLLYKWVKRKLNIDT